MVAANQWRFGITFEGGWIDRISGSKVSSALSPTAALDLRRRSGRDSGAQLSGQQVRLNGGTPNSEAFTNDMRVTVNVWSYTSRTGYDPRAALRIGRVVRQQVPRAALGPRFTPGAARTTTRRATGPDGQQFTVFRLVEKKPVTVLFDNASVVAKPARTKPVLTHEPDPMNVQRKTKIPTSLLRTYVNQNSPLTLRDWLSVESFPGSHAIVTLAEEALRGAQQYAGRTSKTRLGGVRGTDALLAGMPLWTALRGRLSEPDQAGALRSMLDDHWHVEKLTSEQDGATVDLAVSASLTNPVIVPAYGVITTETSAISSVDVDGAKTVEYQASLRGNFSASLRKPGTTKTTSGGGGSANVSYERLLYSRSKRQGRTVSGSIERNANNRKGKTRSFLVKFDIRVTVAAEITTSPAKLSWLPQTMRWGNWLHHHKWIKRDGVVSDAIYLRLTAREVERLGLLPKLDGDVGGFGTPWAPAPMLALRLSPAHGPGLGLYTIGSAPALTAGLIDQLTKAAAGISSGWGARLIGRGPNRSVPTVLKTIVGDGLDDPLLNRERLLTLMTEDGVSRNWASLTDGGVSVLHTEAFVFTQHSRDLRLVATVAGPPELLGFAASHDDLDIKTTHVNDSGMTVQKTYGSTVIGTVAGNGVSNHHGENLLIGVGDTVGRTSQVANAQTHGGASADSQLSSGRGVKARLRLPVTFELVLFDKGKRVGALTLVAKGFVEQDRWADDLRPARFAPAKAPATYEIAIPAQLGPGWRTLANLPLPPRFSPEDLTGLAQLQETVSGLLSVAAKRLAKDGYAGAHQVHQSLTPELLLPAVPELLTDDGLELPPVASTQMAGQRAIIKVKLVPHAVSLGGVSSGVFREHAPLRTSTYSAGTNATILSLRTPRIPMLGRGFVDDPYQPLETGSPSVSVGDSLAAAESGSTATGALGNVKPESASALVDYFCTVEVTIELRNNFGRVRKPESLDGTTTVSLRMGLHDARIALGFTDPASAQLTDFEAIVAREAKLHKAAGAFVDAADELDQARYTAHATSSGAEKIPAAVTKWQDAGRPGGRWRSRTSWRSTTSGARTSASRRGRPTAIGWRGSCARSTRKRPRIRLPRRPAPCRPCPPPRPPSCRRWCRRWHRLWCSRPRPPWCRLWHRPRRPLWCRLWRRP